MNHIRRLREEKGWTQRQLAEKIGVTTDQISKLERGQRRLSQHWMERIASALNTTAAALIGDEPRIPIMGEIAQAGIVQLYKGKKVKNYVPAPPGIPYIHTLAALIVKDDSLLPLCGNDWLLCYRKTEEKPHGLSIVELPDGRVLLREVRKGYLPNTYNLHSHNNPPLEDQAIRLAGRVVALIPA